MAVRTKEVEGRRTLRFESLDDLQADVEQLVSGEVNTLGNWSLAQILTHLAAGLNSTIDGSSFKAPFYILLLAPLLKKKFIYGSIPPGFVIPKRAEAQFLPSSELETKTAAKELRAAVDRVRSSDTCAPHPLFGKLSKEETVQFQLRHAEMHLSFAIPAE